MALMMIVNGTATFLIGFLIFALMNLTEKSEEDWVSPCTSHLESVVILNERVAGRFADMSSYEKYNTHIDSPRTQPSNTQPTLQNASIAMAENAGQQRLNSDEGAFLLMTGAIENLSAHGLPNIAKASSVPRRFTWALLFIAGLGFMIWQATTITQAYFNFDVNTLVEIDRANSLVFPAITVCNMNSISKAKASTFSEELATVLGITYMGAGTSSRSSSTSASSTSTSSPTTTSRSSRSKYQDWDNLDFSSVDSRIDLLEAAQGVIGSVPYANRSESGHELDDMLLSCYFNNYPCSPDNFTQFYNYLYGNCYTFNSPAEGPEQIITQIGPLYGLSMELYIQQDEYLSELQPSAGLRLLIHDRDEMPFPEDRGINLAPGAHTSVGMSLVNLQRKGSPYTNCSSGFKEGNIFADMFPHVKYSRSACEKDCYFKAVYDNCHCAVPMYRYNDSMVPCDLSNSTLETCIDDVESLYTSNDIPCNCTMPCHEDHYRITVSEAKWPNDGYGPTVQASIESISENFMRMIEEQGASEFIESNVVKLGVYFESLQYEYIYQTAAYDAYSLLSDLGGQIGLWIGVSVLTIFEFFELVYDLFRLCCLRLADPQMKRKNARNKTLPKDVMGLVSRNTKTTMAGQANSAFDAK